MAIPMVEKVFAESNDQQVRLQIAAQIAVKELDRQACRIDFVRHAISKIFDGGSEIEGAADIMLSIIHDLDEVRRYSRAALLESKDLYEDEDRDETNDRIRDMEQALTRDHGRRSIAA